MRVKCSNLIIHIYVFAILPQCTMMGLISDTLIECASDQHFAFKLQNSKLNVSRTIAECDVQLKECFMLTKTHNHKYNVTYTGHSGLLKIIVLDKSTIGTYQCYDEFDPMNIVSTNIAPSDYKLAMESCTGNSQEAYGAGQTDTTAHIVLGTLKNASIECSSTFSVTFKFFSNTSKTPITIAECVSAERKCFMFPTPLKNKHSLQYTGCGGVMEITILDIDTIGEYICLAILNPTNNVSFIISFPFTDADVYTTYNVTASTESTGVLENVLKGSATQSYMIPIVIAVVVILFFCCMVIYSKKKSKLCFSSKKTKASTKEDRNSSSPLMRMDDDGGVTSGGESGTYLCFWNEQKTCFYLMFHEEEETFQRVDERVVHKN